MPKGQTTADSASKRIQMDMPPRSVERLKRLQEVTEAASYAEVMKNALRLYEALIEEVEAGNEIMVKRGADTVPLLIFSA